MIVLLDILLIVNLLWAYTSFKNIFSPPVLVGSGMLIASLMATSYYRGWKMEETCFATVFFLGGGTLFFTYSCSLFRRKIKLIAKTPHQLNMTSFNMQKIKIMLLLLIGLSIVCIRLRITEYAAYFGSNMSNDELILNARISLMQSSDLQMSMYLRILTRLLYCFVFIVSWLFSLNIFENKKDKVFLILSIIFLVLQAFSGIYVGDKASVLQVVMSVGTIIIFIYFYKFNTIRISNRILFIILASMSLLFVFFDNFNEFVGRTSHKESNDRSSLLSIYIGAEIKNFDIYIQDNMKKTYAQDEELWAQQTLFEIYKKIYPNELRHSSSSAVTGFQRIGFYELGNVYTLFYVFHRDFGGIGVFIMMFLSAFVSMYLYNNTIQNLNNIYKQNLYLYIYSMATMYLFMFFFGSGFVARFLNIRFIADYITLFLLVIFFDKYCRVRISKKILITKNEF